MCGGIFMATITTLNGIKIRDIINRNESGQVIGYRDLGEAGVTGMFGKLNIRPAYQREFVYDKKKREAVLLTIQKYNAKALSVIWFAKNKDGSYELMDGQQRTISICQYVNGDYAINNKFFHNLPKDEQNHILDQELLIQVFEGTESEKLEWFRTINNKRKKLTEQEIRNAVYAGPFVSDAKKHFSKTNCAAYRLGKDLVNGSPIRQEFFKKALDWMAAHETRYGKPQTIVGYMSEHQHDLNAGPLWTYFQSVLHWTMDTFNMKKFKKIMKGLDWAKFYDEYHEKSLDIKDMEQRIVDCLSDDEIQKPQGIIPYVLTGEERYLDLRAFPEKIKLAVWEQQGHKCTLCGKEFDIEFMEADHITPWCDGGRTVLENCQVLCRECNRRKGGK